jgi:hypothetical protein
MQEPSCCRKGDREGRPTTKSVLVFYFIPIYFSGDEHNYREDGKEADRADKKRIVLIHQQDIEITVQEQEDNADDYSSKESLQYGDAIKEYEGRNRKRSADIGQKEADVLGE